MADILSVSITASQLVLVALTAIAAIGTFYWSNVRITARRLSIVDLATKQIAFWDQALKLELAATTDQQEQDEARCRAYTAVQRIRSNADQELERLAWNRRTTVLLLGNKPAFTLKWPSNLTRLQKIDWLFYKTFALLALVMMVLLFLLFIYSLFYAPHHLKNFAAQVLCSIMICASAFLAGYLSRAARRLAFPAKPVPLLDRL